MKIVAGKFKNKNIKFISDETTRPTAEIVRQALFTKLQFNFPLKNCLDLFAGSGSLGLEAMSRGAEHAYFVENNRRNFNLIKDNLTNFGINFETNCFSTQKEASLIFADALKALENFNVQFDLILMDPPYQSAYYEKALEIIHKNNLLSSNGIIVLEHDQTKNFEINTFQVLSQKKYGRRMLTYLGNMVNMNKD